MSSISPHATRQAGPVALSAALVLLSTSSLLAGPQISVNGNLITRPNEALPLKVVHGKAIRLGDDLPALTAELFEPVYLHEKSSVVSDSFYDPNRGDGLPVKEMMAGPSNQLESVAPVRTLVRVQPELPRLDPMVMTGRLTLLQVPSYVASLKSEDNAREQMESASLFADLKTSRQDLPELTDLPDIQKAEPVVAVSAPVPEAKAAPAASNPLLASAEALPAPTQSAPKDNLDGIAAPEFSLAKVAQEKAFLESAWTNYDQDKEEFKATWSKPPLFHYGMVLLPEIAKRVKPGQEVEFRYRDMPATLTKDEKGRLFVTAAGEARLVTAGKLKKLLEEKIETDGMILFLDRKGNLVLHASGQNALVMNQHASR